MLLATLPTLAHAQALDAPLIVEIEGGYFVNHVGMKKLNDELAVYQRGIISLSAENARLKTETEAMAALTWTAAVLFVGAGLVVGSLVTYAATR